MDGPPALPAPTTTTPAVDLRRRAAAAQDPQGTHDAQGAQDVQGAQGGGPRGPRDPRALPWLLTAAELPWTPTARLAHLASSGALPGVLAAWKSMGEPPVATKVLL